METYDFVFSHVVVVEIHLKASSIESRQSNPCFVLVYSICFWLMNRSFVCSFVRS